MMKIMVMKQDINCKVGIKLPDQALILNSERFFVPSSIHLFV